MQESRVPRFTGNADPWHFSCGEVIDLVS